MPGALLFDTSSLFFRAFHALPPMSTKAGEPTSAVYGFSVLLLKLLRERRPTGVAFARDMPVPTFRHAEYTEYKAGRPPMPDLLKLQWHRLDQLLHALGTPVHGVPGYEADDVLATLSGRVGPATLVSGDRDLFQRVGPETDVLFLGARGQKPEIVDVAEVARRYGVTPERMPAVMALVGEAADNLVGVAGVGVKTAAKLVGAHGSVAALLDALAAGAAPEVPSRLVAPLREAGERLRTNERLATLRTDVPLAEPLVAPVGVEGLGRVRGLFEELEFVSLVGRVDALVARG